METIACTVSCTCTTGKREWPEYWGVWAGYVGGMKRMILR